MNDIERNLEEMLIEIKQLTKKGGEVTLWLLPDNIGWREKFPANFDTIFSILPEPTISSPLLNTFIYPIWDKLYSMGLGEFKCNLYATYGVFQFWHQYVATNIPNVFIHIFSWSGEAWGGDEIIVSVNIPEERFKYLRDVA